MRKMILLGASALSTMAAAGAASAQAPVEVEGVQVTARTLEDTLPEQLARTGVKVAVIPGPAIRNGGYPDIATALQTLAPGVFVLPENGPFSTTDVSVLGGRNQDVLWLVDGVRINNRLFASGAGNASSLTPLDTVPAGVVDHIELIDGGQSLFYGTQAVSGAINIVTRPFTERLSGQARVAYDSNTDRHIDASLSDKIAIGQFVIYGSADKSDGYQAFRDQDYQPSAGNHKRDYQVHTEGVKYQADLNAQVRVQGSYQRSDATLDLPWPYRIAHNFTARAEDLATAKVDWQATDRLSLYVKGYWHNWNNHTTLTLNSPLGTTITAYDKAFWGYKDYGLNALGKYDLAKGLEAYFGYDLQRYGGRDDQVLITQHDEIVHAGFGQLRWTPEGVPHLSLAAGGRYNAPSSGPSSAVWNLSGQYDWPMGLYTKAEVGTNFRLPSAEELYANDATRQERGNPNLKSEESIGGEFTLGTRLDVLGHATRLEATGFARDIRNAIDFVTFDTSINPLTKKPYNQYVFGNLDGVTTTRGGQLEVDTALTPSLKANLAYTYTETRDGAGVQLNNIPVQQLKAGLDWNPATLPVGVTANVAYTGKTTAPYASGVVNYGEYATVNLSGRWFLDAARHHQLNLAVQNLFDRAYGRFYRGCVDVVRDFPLGCSKPYPYQGLALPRTVQVAYRYSF
ncbi:MAG: TonB-dependent receptor plug domain-containing protein [Caulobacteraceae bacterium]